jgi:hypothetical protein
MGHVVGTLQIPLSRTSYAHKNECVDRFDMQTRARVTVRSVEYNASAMRAVSVDADGDRADCSQARQLASF